METIEMPTPPSKAVLGPALAMLLAPAAPGQEGRLAFMAVDDLLADRVQRDPYLTNLRLPGARWIRGEASLAPELTRDDYERLGQSGSVLLPAGYFGSKQLVYTLATLSGLPEGEIVVTRGGATLGVPAARADGMREVLDALRQRLPPRVQVDVRLTRTQGGQTAVLGKRTVECISGAARVLSTVEQQPIVFEYEVEIAASAPVANPNVTTLASGVMVALRVSLEPGGGSALAEILARTIDRLPDEPIDNPVSGPIDRAAQRTTESGRVCRVHPGGRTVQQWCGADGGSYELELVTRWVIPRPMRPGGHDLEYTAAVGPFGGFRSTDADRSVAGEPELRSAVGDAIEGAAMTTFAALDETMAPYVAFDGDALELRAAATSMFASLETTSTVDVQCFDVPRDAAGTADGAVPAGARLLGSTKLDVVHGTWACATSYDESSIVRDWDVEVAEAARIPDPKVARSHHGFWLNLRASAGHLEIEGEYSRRSELRRDLLTLSQAIGVPSDPGTERTSTRPNQTVKQPARPGLSLAADCVFVDRPIVQRAPFAARLALRGGTGVARFDGGRTLGPDRELLLVVRAAQ
jgi:hypothetical protein